MVSLRQCLLVLSLAFIYEAECSRRAAFNCYPTPKMCKGSLTGERVRTPNVFNHTHISDAVLSFKTFEPLIQTGCFSELRPFLCSLYFPPCRQSLILPSAQMYDRVRRGCEPVMNRFGYKWPESMSCDRFRSGLTQMPSTVTTTATPRPYGATFTPPPQCSEREFASLRYSVRRAIDEFESGGQCKSKLIDDLYSRRRNTNSRSGLRISSYRLRRVEKLIKKLSSQMKILTSMKKARNLLASLKRLLGLFS